MKFKLKNQIFLMFFISILTGCFNDVIEKSDLEKMNLEGRVKSVKMISFKAEIGGFDKIIKNERIDANQDVLYIFNEDGKLIEKNQFGFFNEEGRSVSGNTNELGVLSTKIIYKYDEKGYLTEKKMFVSDGSLYTKTICKNDKYGKLTEEQEFYADGNYISNIIYSYEKNTKTGIIY